MESLELWIALSPKQLEELNKGKEAVPDEYSDRFGLRTEPAAVSAANSISRPDGSGLRLNTFRKLRVVSLKRQSQWSIVGMAL